MRIIFTCDLHLPITPAATIQDFASVISKQKPDILILGGDLGETRISAWCFDDCLKIFRKAMPDVALLVIAGNHDLWVDSDLATNNSMELWSSILPQMTAEQNGVWLESSNFIKDGVCVVGSMLHYDYSAKDKVGPVSQLPDEYFIINKRKLGMNDAVYFKGLPPDKDFAKQIGEAFMGRLMEAEADENVKSIVVATHVPCTEEQMTRRPQDYDWAISTPFFGNLTYESRIKACKKVRYVLSGHSHRHAHVVGETMTIMNIESDYKAPVFASFEI